MHHKRKRSVSREGRRMDNKSYRMAEGQALHAQDRHPGIPRIDKWGYRPDPLPVFDQPSNGKKHGKKKTRKPKEKCPANGTHEWYKEWVEETHYHCYTWAPGGFTVHERIHRATCIHCWVEKNLKVIRQYREDSDPRVTRRGKKEIKRRQIDTVSGMTLR